MASGVFAGVAMVLVAVCGRLGWRAALAAGAATAVLLTVYLIGYKPTPHPAPPEDSFLTLYPSYLLAFLGNVWAFGRPEWSIAFGLVVAGLTAAMVAVVWFGKVRDPARLTMLGIVLFIGMAAGVTTLGRLGYGIDQALSSRYQTPVSYLWAAHALFWGLTLCRVERAWWKALAAAPLVVALIFVIPVQNRGLRELSWLREYVALGSSALVGGIDDDKALLRLYPEARRVREFRPFLRSHGLGLFADDPGFQVGSLLPRDRLVEPQACAGAFDVLDPDPGGGASWRALGWAWDLQQRRRFDRILIVDAAGVVAGVAVGKIRRDDVAKHRGDVKTHSAGWAGLVQPRPGQELTAYGVRRGGTLCELGRKAPAA
jgi:hypothetical protein